MHHHRSSRRRSSTGSIRSGWLAVGLLAALGCSAVGCGVADGSATAEEQELREQWQPTEVREGNLRIATFNIRNYPFFPVDPEAEPRPEPLAYQPVTDDEALLTVLVKLDFDVMAVQEIIDVELFRALLERLNLETGRAYQAVFAQNEAGNPQHVGIVVDSLLVRMEAVEEHEAIDVRGTLRPGLSARIQSLRDGGVDFGLMSLHLASGSSASRAVLRAEQAAVAAEIVAQQRATAEDGDFLVLGDLNTAREGEEFGLLDAAFDAGTALLRQPNESGCSSYWIKKRTNPLLRVSWLDHVYASSLDELDVQVPILSGAHCAERLCQQFESTDPQSGSTFWNVSDHCPVYFEIQDVDFDDEPVSP